MRRHAPLLHALALAACSPAHATTLSAGPDTGTATSGGGSTAATLGDSSTGPGPTTGASGSEGGITSGGPGGSTGEGSSSTTDLSSGGPSTGGASTGDASTGDSSTGGSSTSGGDPVASFTCVETTPVELPLKESISGSFLADGTPVDLTAVMVKGGAIDFHVDVAAPIDPNDPNAADVAAFEAWLKMQAWDVNPPGDMSGDRRYFFAPKGAQNVAIFPAFYFRVYEGGGNGQFEFDCSLL